MRGDNPHVVASALANAVHPDDRRVYRGQRIGGLARRAVVFIPVPSGCCAEYVPSPGEVRGSGVVLPIGACPADPGPPGRCDFVSPGDEKQAFREGEVQAAVVGGGCDVPEVPVVLEQCANPLDSDGSAGGTGTCGNEAWHAEHFQAGIQRVAAHIQVEA